MLENWRGKDIEEKQVKKKSFPLHSTERHIHPIGTSRQLLIHMWFHKDTQAMCTNETGQF